MIKLFILVLSGGVTFTISDFYPLDMNPNVQFQFHARFQIFLERTHKFPAVFDEEAAWLLFVGCLYKDSILGVSHTRPVRWSKASDMSGN